MTYGATSRGTAGSTARADPITITRTGDHDPPPAICLPIASTTSAGPRGSESPIRAGREMT
jgi:hypothetical protein